MSGGRVMGGVVAGEVLRLDLALVCLLLVGSFLRREPMHVKSLVDALLRLSLPCDFAFEYNPL